MDEEALNISLRKFLKKVGVTAQREIEKTVREKLEKGELRGDETLKAEARLTLGDTELDLRIDGDITLE